MGGECILIVDGNPLVRRMLERFLRKENFRSLSAASANEALINIRRESPDIVLLDVQLQDANGLEFIKEHLIPEAGPYRVIVLTAFNSNKDAEEAVLAGAYDYLTKPLHLAKLKIAIQNCLKLQAMAREIGELSCATGDSISLRDFVGTSPKILELIEQIKRIAPFDVPVLILGESGTGKELVAQLLHSLSPRRKGPFVPIDCGAIPDTLVESEMFGYEPGAFSGATQIKLGKIERANNGTILLDEVGNLPTLIQPKLLRTLQFMQIERLGGKQSVSVDVRILAATNADIEKMVEGGALRHDLYHRLNTMVLKLPPLRQRVEDIRLLTHYALLKANQTYGTKIRGISSEAVAVLESYAWPGNVRELENCIRSAVILADKIIKPSHLPERIRQPRSSGSESDPVQAHREEEGVPHPSKSLFQIGRHAAAKAERAAILSTLHATGWNKAEAARRLRVDYKALCEKVRRYEVRFPLPKDSEAPRSSGNSS
jgi:DNA-binding NtrC family response regulator